MAGLARCGDEPRPPSKPPDRARRAWREPSKINEKDTVCGANVWGVVVRRVRWDEGRVAAAGARRASTSRILLSSISADVLRPGGCRAGAHRGGLAKAVLQKLSRIDYHYHLPTVQPDWKHLMGNKEIGLRSALILHLRLAFDPRAIDKVRVQNLLGPRFLLLFRCYILSIPTRLLCDLCCHG